MLRQQFNEITDRSSNLSEHTRTELKRRRQQQRQKTIGFMSKTTALHVHHAFYFISLTSTVRLRRETSCDVF